MRRVPYPLPTRLKPFDGKSRSYAFCVFKNRSSPRSRHLGTARRQKPGIRQRHQPINAQRMAIVYLHHHGLTSGHTAGIQRKSRRRFGQIDRQGLRHYFKVEVRPPIAFAGPSDAFQSHRAASEVVGRAFLSPISPATRFSGSDCIAKGPTSNCRRDLFRFCGCRSRPAI